MSYWRVDGVYVVERISRMKIKCLPRKWFEMIKGTVLEEQVLAQNKIVSIQSRPGWDSEPPFSEEGLKSPNLLCLTFDDVTDYSDLDDGGALGDRALPMGRFVGADIQPFYGKVAKFRPVMAQKILKHVGHGSWPVLIHCTEGVSRSGAVASVLDHYWNFVWDKKPEDHEYFKRVNPKMSPNPVVEEIFTEYIENGYMDEVP